MRYTGGGNARNCAKSPCTFPGGEPRAQVTVKYYVREKERERPENSDTFQFPAEIRDER